MAKYRGTVKLFKIKAATQDKVNYISDWISQLNN